MLSSSSHSRTRSADPSPQRLPNGHAFGGADLKSRSNYSHHRSNALPRSADPSPSRTAARIENLHRLSNRKDNTGAAREPASSFITLNPHFKHQVLYVCHGHCSGPECEFTQSIRRWQSMVMLGDHCFRSEVVEKSPMSLKKLDEQRKDLSQMRKVLASKLESKQRHKGKKKAGNPSKSSLQNTPGPAKEHEKAVVNQDEGTGSVKQGLMETDRTDKASTNSPVSKDEIDPKSESIKEDIEEVIRTRHQHRRRTLSAGKQDGETLSSKLPINQSGNATTMGLNTELMDITAQDLLGKSHQELVLLLIRLKRQSTLLNDNIQNAKMEFKHHSSSQQWNQRIRELEEQQSKSAPILSLVDNMVKLGSLYRGPEDAPLSHRIRNLPGKKNEKPKQLQVNGSKPKNVQPLQEEFEVINQQRKADIQLRLLELYHIEVEFSEERLNIKYLFEEKDLLDRSLDQVNRDILETKFSANLENHEEFEKQKQMLENELMRVSGQLELSHKKLDENSGEHARWEHDLLFLRQQLQQSASRDMQYGIDRSAETLAIEGELAQVQQRATDFHKERQEIIKNIQILSKSGDEHTSSENVTPVMTDKLGTSKRPTVGTKRACASIEDGTSKPLDLTSMCKELSDRGRKGKLVSKSPISDSLGYSNLLKESKEGKIGTNDKPLGDLNDDNIRIQRLLGIMDKPSEVSQDPKTQLEPSALPSLLPKVTSHESVKVDGTGENGNIGAAVLKNVPNRGQSLPRNYNFSFSNPDFSGLAKSTLKIGDYYKKKTIQNKDPSERPLTAHERLFGPSRDNPVSIDPITSAKKYATSSPLKPDQNKAKPKPLTASFSGNLNLEGKIENIVGVLEETKLHAQINSIKGINDDPRPESNALDVKKSVLDTHNPHVSIKKDSNKFSTTSIDSLLGAPQKIDIPERYIPDSDEENLTSEEKQARLKKAESIRKMLADTQATTSGDGTTSIRENSPILCQREKKEREHLLALNQMIAQQVMAKSKMVAVRALADRKCSYDDLPKSPDSDVEDDGDPLPLYQQRESILS